MEQNSPHMVQTSDSVGTLDSRKRLARSGLTPDKIITAKSVENAARVLLALGGSTNGVIHLAAIAGRLR